MNPEERLIQISKELPEPMRAELLDFAEFLNQRKVIHHSGKGNLAERIHARFAELSGDDIRIPARKMPKKPPVFS